MSKLFLPYILDENGKSLSVDGGALVKKPVPAQLKHSPDGWENSVIQFSRDKDDYSLIRKYTTQLKFYFDGARILREFYYRSGVEAVCQFVWLKQNLQFGAGMKYEGWYKGEPDFSTFKDDENVEIAINEGGFYKEYQAGKDITEEIPLTDAVSVMVDGMELGYKMRYSTAEEEYVFTDLLNSTFYTKEILPTFSFISAEPGVAADLSATTQTREESGPNGSIISAANLNCFLENAITNPPIYINATFKLSAHIRVVSMMNQQTPVGTEVLLEVVNQNKVRKLLILDDKNFTAWQQGQALDKDYKVSKSGLISILPGEKLFFRMHIRHMPGLGVVFDILEEFSDFSYNYTATQSIINAMPALQLGDTLCRRMSKGKSGLKSDLLTLWEGLLITSGDAVRGLPNAVIKTKFKDFNKSIDAVLCSTFGIENNEGRLENREYAFQNYEISDLGEVSDFNLEPAKEYIYDTIVNGFPTKDVGGEDGKYQFNNTVNWKLPYTRVKNEYNIRSVYLADPFIIEIVRINMDGKETTDNSADNDVFFLDCTKVERTEQVDAIFHFVGGPPSISTIELDGVGYNILPGQKFRIKGSDLNDRTYTAFLSAEVGAVTSVTVLESVAPETKTVTLDLTVYKLHRPVYTSITGIPYGNGVFNIELSPKRSLQKHYPWLKSISNTIEWKSADRNADLVTVDTGTIISDPQTIVEKANVTLSAVTGIFLPHIVSFKVKSPMNLLEKMKSNNGYFTFYHRGVKMKGYPIDIKTNDATMETQTYTLLLTYNNDLTHLIE